MGDTHSCLREPSSSSLDMAKDVRAPVQRGHVAELDLEERDKLDGGLIDLGEADSELLNLEGSEPGALPGTARDVKGKKPKQPDIVPRRRPRGIGDESFPKPKNLSHTARRERLEELKRLNQQLKNLPQNPPPPAKFEPDKRTVAFADFNKQFEGNQRPSLLELEVQALATLGFVQLQPDILVEAGPSQRKSPNDFELPHTRRAGPAIMATKKEPEREDLLELEKVALRSMMAEKKPVKSSPEVGAGGDLLELEKVARASLEGAHHPEAAPQALPSSSNSQETAQNDSKKTVSRVRCILHPPSSSPSQDMTKSDLPEIQKKAQPRVKCILHSGTTAEPTLKTTHSKPPLPPPYQDSGKSNVVQVQKMAQSKGKSKVHTAGTPSKPLLPPSEGTPKRDLLELEKGPQPNRKCLLQQSSAPLSLCQSVAETEKSVPMCASCAPEKPSPPPPSQKLEKRDLLEIQKVALASMKGTSVTSHFQSGAAPPAAPPVASERGDLLELEKVALANMRETSTSVPSTSQSVAPANAPPPAVERGDLLELEKVALASMMASAKPSQVTEETFQAGPKPAAKTCAESVRSDLLELERQDLANMKASNEQASQPDLKVKTSITTKDDVASSAATPTSACSSFHLEPASGPFETMLVELTTKDKALQAANRKVAEKDQLLHEYEGELSKALRMLESMNVRCTDAKEETARALSEAKGIYDELNQAWSAVEDLECRSKDGAVSPVKGCSKLREMNSKFEEEERKTWIEDLLDELQTIESVRTEAHRDFELEIRRNEQIIGELQHMRANPSFDHMLGTHERICQDTFEEAHEHGNETKFGEREDDDVFEGVCLNEPSPQKRSLERTSEQLVLELRKIESTWKKNQRVFQDQMDRNQQVLAQLHELQNCYQEGRQKSVLSSEQEKQWEAETTQLNKRLLELHEALDKKTKEANELHEQSLRLHRGVLEQEQKLEKALKQHKLDMSSDTKSVTADFIGDTSDLEVFICSSCSSTPVKTDFEGDTMDLESWAIIRSTCPLADYICSTCSSGPTDSDCVLPTKICRSVKDTADFECDTRELESISMIDFEGDTHELENYICTLHREDKGVQVRREDRENKKLTQEREIWEEERTELIKRLDDFEASLLTKEKKIGNLIDKLDREESTSQDEKYQLVKRCEECETSLLAKEEEVIELSTQLEMAKSSLQGFTCTDSSTVVSTSSESMLAPVKKAPKIGSKRFGRSDARELLDLRCEVFSLQECLVIKGEALKTMEKELARSYTIINELRTKLARSEESERSLQSQRLDFDDLKNNNGQKIKGKVAKKPRLLREIDQSSVRSNQNHGDLIEKLRVQTEKLAALKKERAIMSRKIEDLQAKCKFLDGVQKLHNGSQDSLKAEAIMDLEKELQRNVEIVQKLQSRCTEFESRAIQAEGMLKQAQSGDKLVLAGPGIKEKRAWQAERQGLLAGLKYFRELTEKKDEELYGLRYELRTKMQKQIQTPPCKSKLVIISPEQRLDENEVVHDAKPAENLQLARLHAPAAIVEHNENQSLDEGDGNSQALQIREITNHLREQWKLQCVMEDRLDAMMAYVSERVKEFEQNRNISPTANFTQFHEEATLMKVQLEQQLQVLRGTLSTSFHKLDEAKRQLQVAMNAGTEFLCCPGFDTDRSGDAAGDAKVETFQLLTDRVALEDSAQTLQEKTSRLLHRLTSTRLHWNMNMLAASMAAG